MFWKSGQATAEIFSAKGTDVFNNVTPFSALFPVKDFTDFPLMWIVR